MSISPTRWSADELIPFGKYILLNKISAGATAAVYRAKIRGEAGFERLVTIKRILPQMAGDQDFVETFVREAKVCARLTHGNICPIYELGKVGESLYMASEWVSGKDLRAITARLQSLGRAMPPLAAAWIASRLCDALDYAHGLKDASGERLNILHQDLSPANIVVSYDGAVKLLDFGIARATGRAQQTNVDALKQKLGYMSPELVLGTQVDRRSDLFGVGVCLYEMVTGKRLFAGSDDIATLKLLRNATVEPPSALREDTPEELEQIIMRSLARDPEARWPSAGEMAHALSTFIAAQDPAYSPRKLAELMQDLFDEDKQAEQTKLHTLLTASQDPQLMEQRRRFFASPQGAAAVARVEASRKLASTRPPAMGAADNKVTTKSKVPASPESSITGSHIAERGATARAPDATQDPQSPNTDDADAEPTTYRPPVLETPRPGAVAQDGLTTAATYDELIRRSREDEEELTTYRAEPAATARPVTQSGKQTSKQLVGFASASAGTVPPELSLKALQEEPTVFELDPAEYIETSAAEARAAARDAEERKTGAEGEPGPEHKPETEHDTEHDTEHETEVDFEAEATNYLGQGQPNAALALFAPSSTASSGAVQEEEATKIFFSLEEGLDLPEVPDDELTTVSPPTPLRVPPPAGAASVSGAARPSGRQDTGAHRALRTPSTRVGEATLPKVPLPAASSARMPTQILSPVPVKAERGATIWIITALVLVFVSALIARTSLGVSLGFRKPPNGVIEIRTTPVIPATVRLDNIYHGRAPMRLEGVPAGTRVLQLQADGYEPVTRSVTLEGGATVQESFTLTPLTPPPTP